MLWSYVPSTMKTWRSCPVPARASAEPQTFRCRIAFPIRPNLVADADTLDEVGVARLLHRGDMHEEVSAAIVGDDEAVALLRIEPLYLPGGHGEFPEDLLTQARVSSAPAPRDHSVHMDCRAILPSPNGDSSVLR